VGYDFAGRMTTFSYDYEDRVSSITRPGMTCKTKWKHSTLGTRWPWRGL